MPLHIACIAPAAEGHVNPTLPLVEELGKRGHRVTYATGGALVRAARSAGADTIDMGGEIVDPPTGLNSGINPVMMAQMMHRFLDHAREWLPVLAERLAEDMPDVICYDVMTMIGPMLAEKLGVPAVALVPNFAANERFSLADMFMPDGIDFDAPELREAHAERVRLAEEFGVTTPASMFDVTPADLNLVFIPRSFQLASETFDDRFRFLGPSLGRRVDSDPFAPDETRQRLLYISLGTAFNDRPDFFRRCLEAFGDGKWHVAMSVGHRIDPADLGEVPDNFDVRPRFDQPAVLEHADVFLSHTGMNSTMESVYHGVPLVAHPQMPEQRANAHRVEELGYGQVLPDEFTATELRELVDEVADDSHVRATISAAGGAVRNGGGALAGADALEAHLARRG